MIFGSSLGAYGAVDLAVENPEVFGLCAAIAPPAQASTLLTNQSQGVRAVQGVRFFVLGAVYDTDVKGARTLRAALEEESADVTYVEVPEGHAAETFRGRIDDALKQLIPPGTVTATNGLRSGGNRRQHPLVAGLAVGHRHLEVVVGHGHGAVVDGQRRPDRARLRRTEAVRQRPRDRPQALSARSFTIAPCTLPGSAEAAVPGRSEYGNTCRCVSGDDSR